jgi:hypothetical protein
MALKDQKDVLIAWINGETIQFENGNQWSDCDKFGEVAHIRLDSCTYRIKPKEIVTTTHIKRDTCSANTGLHSTFSNNFYPHNLRLTWSPDGETLLKAEVI